MKKLLCLIMISLLFITTGCGKNSSSNVINDLKSKLDKSSGYTMSGSLEINNNDETYNYQVVVDYKKDDFYKVSLVNTANDFQQIILKNKDGVFLLTPALNKSFKFQSSWPYNNSQIYLLDALIKDVENDQNHTFKEKNDLFEIETSVDYPNNSKLKRQKIVFDKDKKLKRIVVYDNNDIICMKFIVENIKFSPKFSDDYFGIDTITDDENENDEELEEDKNNTKNVSVIEDVLYPLMIPSGTKLVGEERVSKDYGERVIMNYDGEKSFLLVEETMDVFQEFTVIPSSGEPFQLLDTIGVMTDNSLSWCSGNLEYYLVSDVMSQDEMIEIAQSIVGVSSFK